MTPVSKLLLGGSESGARKINWMKKKKCCKGMLLLPHTTPLSFSGIFFFRCVHSSKARLLIFGAVAVHPERRY